MKGLLFNVVEDVVTEVMSADAWDDVLVRSGASGAYTSLGNYPDSELIGIVGEVADAADLPVEDTLQLAGRVGFPHLGKRAPELIADYAGWRDVLLSLDDIIHPEVLKVYPDADLPRFTVLDDGEELVLEYESTRRFCSLAAGLIVGCGEWFDTSLEVIHDACVDRGDPACHLRVLER